MYCSKCNPDPLAETGRILCLSPGCSNMSDGGRCSRCAFRARYREDPAERERQKRVNQEWRDKNPERYKVILKRAQDRHRLRKTLGGKFPDPLEG